LEGVRNIYDETEARAYELGHSADRREAEALLISGTGLPTAGIVQRLEEDLGKPVITGQTAALWHALRVAGLDARGNGSGRLPAGRDTSWRARRPPGLMGDAVTATTYMA